jgi:hypothetical protein
MADWKKRARDARTKLKHAKHGEKEALLRGLAGGNDLNTLRRAIFALGYLDEVKQRNPLVRKSLEHSPLSLVELLARWNSFDVAGAVQAAREVAKGRYTVADLRKAIHKARLAVAAKTEPSSYRDRIRPVARRAVEDALGGSISAPDVGFKDSDDPPLDFRYLRSYGEPPRFETIAAVIVGPYQNSQLYRKRKHDWLYRALGLAWLYDHVVIILPEPNEVDSYKAWINNARTRAERLEATQGRGREPSVHVMHLAEPRTSLADVEEAAILSSTSG